MASEDDLKENLLNPRPTHRAFWWNVGLVVMVLAIAAIVFNGVMKRRRAHAPEVPPPAAVPATANPAPAFKVPEPAAAALPPSPGAANALLDQIRAIRAAGDRLKAREQCHELLARLTDVETVRAIEDMIGELNVELVSTPAAMPEKTDYVVKPGDSLARIAKQFGTTVELVQLGNQVRGNVIRPGDRMRVFSAPLTLRVNKTRNELVVFAADRFFKRYRVGTGKHGTTPAGVFVINDKIAEPPWWRPDGKVVPFGDKENVLGTRWLSLKPIEDTDPVRGYGIHGTWEPETIGKQASAGCVRLLNEDVEQLYVLLPLGTRVVIEE